MIPAHKVSLTCNGEKCSVCKDKATHKLGEEIAYDINDFQHNLTAYVCCTHFRMIVGGVCKPKGD